MNRTQHLSVELRKVSLQIKYGTHDKRSYMFFWEDYLDILKDVDEQIGLQGGLPRNFDEDHVFRTNDGYEITLDPKDWEAHDEDQKWSNPDTGKVEPVSIPEIGEPRLILRKDGREWKMTPSGPEALYRLLRIRPKRWSS